MRDFPVAGHVPAVGLTNHVLNLTAKEMRPISEMLQRKANYVSLFMGLLQRHTERNVRTN